MTKDLIDEIAEEVDLPKPLVKYILETSGKYIHKHLATTDVSRFTIKNFGTWRVNLININNEIRYVLIRLLRSAKKRNSKEEYQRLKDKFKYIWTLRQNAIKYELSRKKNGSSK